MKGSPKQASFFVNGSEMKFLHHKTENWEFAAAKTPLVLLHGFLEDLSMWDQLEFPTNYPIVRIDLPGHGGSKDFLCDTIEEMAIQVLSLLTDLKLESFHVIGHSMGGYVALELKKNDPRCKKIMLLNSNFWTDSDERAADRRRIAEIVMSNQSHFIYEVIPNLFLDPQSHDAMVKKLIQEALLMSPGAIGKASIAMSVRANHTDLALTNASDITCIQGVEDRIVTVDQMRSASENSSLKVIEFSGVGHMAHIEAPDKVNVCVVDFLN